MEESSRRENVVLVGFMGTGKSAIGRQLARRMGFQFLDTDYLITERQRKGIAEIFAELGEESFRDLETQTLESLEHLRRCVISTGGGIVLRDTNRTLLRRIGFVVELTASPEVIFERVSRNAKRPLLQTEDPRGTMEQLLVSRAENYRAAADWSLDTSIVPPPEAAAQIMEEARRAFSWQGTA